MPAKLGKVYLIGAGPGDPKLLTLRAVELLRLADVVLYDGLVNPSVLVHVQANCEQICVGKHGQSRHWTQAEIDDQLVDFAKRGKLVARLKGGDPAVFARTAEELDRLVRESIPFEVVPGITAALAASSYAGIPITHRDWASAVAFVTAQTQAIDGGEEAEEPLDWEALARFPGTLVFYMGVTTAARWSRRLIEAGKSELTPTALVRRCSLPDQQVIHCSLSEVANHLTPSTSFRPPVITIVGNVTTLAHTLDWFSKRPLFGTSILLTRPLEESNRCGMMLEELGAEVLHQPAISIALSNECEYPRDWLARISEFDWILFSSRHGVEHFMSLLWESGLDLRALGSAKLATVGPSTAETLERYHLKCDRVPSSNFGAASLVSILSNEVRGKKCLLVRGDRGQPILEERLGEAGAMVAKAIVYNNVEVSTVAPVLTERMQGGKIDFTTVSSPSIAMSVIRMFGERLHKTRLVTLSANISEVLRESGFSVFAELTDTEWNSPDSWTDLIRTEFDG